MSMPHIDPEDPQRSDSDFGHLDSLGIFNEEMPSARRSRSSLPRRKRSFMSWTCKRRAFGA